MINWQIITRKNISTIRQFILQHEYYAVYATEHIQQFGTTHPPSGVIIACYSESNVVAVIVLSRDGMLYLLFNPLHRMIIINALLATNFYRKIYSSINAIYGHPDNVLYCYTMMKKHIPHRKSLMIKYDVYTKQQCISYNEIPPMDVNNIVCSRATIDLIDDIYRLHKEYLIEEVQIDRHTISKSRVYDDLRAQIETKAVFIAIKSGVVIAKCAINACGIDYDQIGGVYTVPTYRHNKVALHLLLTTNNSIIQKQKKAMLFVKESNATARKIYTKLGFVSQSKLSIVYLHS